LKEGRDIPNAPNSLPSATEEVESEVSMSDTIFDFLSQKHVSAEIVRKDENMERDVFHRELFLTIQLRTRETPRKGEQCSWGGTQA